MRTVITEKFTEEDIYNLKKIEGEILLNEVKSEYNIEIFKRKKLIIISKTSYENIYGNKWFIPLIYNSEFKEYFSDGKYSNHSI